MDRIGKYEIQSLLGRGGFGRVYKAFDPTVRRSVAIKVMAAESGEIDDDLRARFRTEANATGGLRHKNIVTIYDYGEIDGMPFLVMEYLEGRDLQKVIDEGHALTLLEKVTILVQVAEGLHHAHQSGIVHRDVKPANIMILKDGSVKIMDFGIARLVQDTGNRLTQRGDIVGTIAYTAPEQFWGGEVDHLSDIFAYGVIFYELISGSHPFRSPKVETARIIFSIGTVNPPPVSSLVPGCPAALDHLIERAIQKSREARYPSFEDLHFDIVPIRLELQDRFVEEKIGQAQELFAAGKLDEAQAVVREALLHDPGNTNARRLREGIRMAAGARPARERANQLAASAGERLSAGDHPKAVELAEEALKIDPGNAGIAALLEQARAAMEKARREQRIGETLGRAKALAVAGSYDDALALLMELGQDYPDSARVRKITEALRAKKQQELERRLDTQLRMIRELISSGNLRESLASVECLAKDFPSNEEVRSLAADISAELHIQQNAEEIDRIRREAQALAESELKFRKREVARLEQEIQSLIDAGRYADAGRAAGAALLEHPSHARFAALKTETERTQHQHTRADAIAAALELAEKLRRAGDLAAAIVVLSEVEGRFGGDRSVVLLIEKLAAEKEARDRGN
jgi:serine/threonine-protein kinase